MIGEYDDDLEVETVTSPIDKKFWDYFDATAVAVSTADVEEPRDQAVVLATYAALLVVGGVGNVAVLAALTRQRRRRSRVDLLMTHLAIADVAVTCGVIPLEVHTKHNFLENIQIY